jgi:hypothetical protein
VFICHARLPAKPHASRASTGECATPTLRSTDPPRSVACSPQRARARTVGAMRHSCTSTVVYVSQRVVQVAESRFGLCQRSAGGDARHAMRVTHVSHLSYSVSSLCSECPRRVNPRWRSEGQHTERSLQLYDSHHDRITQLVHQQQLESQELLPVPHRSGSTEPSGGAGLTQL